MLVIGVTGGVACGKSQAAGYIREQGFPVIDCDAINRRLQAEDRDVLKHIQNTFPDVFENGCLNRQKLVQKAFANANHLRLIGSIMQAPIQREINARLAQYEKEEAKIVFIDAPLLFETGLDKICTQTICIYVPETVQKERFLRRAGMTAQAFECIEQTQLPLSEKKKRADTLILSDTPDHLHTQINTFLNTLPSQKIGFFAGSFDPMTNGHLYLLCQAVLRCDTVYVGIGVNPEKKYLLTTQERIDCVNAVIDEFIKMEPDKIQTFAEESIKTAHQKLKENPQMIRVVSYEGLTVDAAIKAKANMLLRGARNSMDKAFEVQLNAINQVLLSVREAQIENIILEAPQNLVPVSSSAVKELFSFREYIAVQSFVPACVYTTLLKKYLSEPFMEMCAFFHLNKAQAETQYHLFIKNTDSKNLAGIARTLNKMKIKEPNPLVDKPEKYKQTAAVFFQQTPLPTFFQKR